MHSLLNLDRAAKGIPLPRSDVGDVAPLVAGRCGRCVIAWNGWANASRIWSCSRAPIPSVLTLAAVSGLSAHDLAELHSQARPASLSRHSLQHLAILECGLPIAVSGLVHLPGRAGACRVASARGSSESAMWHGLGLLPTRRQSLQVEAIPNRSYESGVVRCKT
jgi:hypothetical protein